MKEILKKVFNNEQLSNADIHSALAQIIAGSASSEDAADLLCAISAKGETSSELVAFAEFMRKSAKRPLLRDKTGFIDVCGTGGDCLGTFNISTAVSFVITGAGAKVVKHGNRSVSSKSGSADVLEKLGISIELPEEKLQAMLDDAGMVFLFAPRYHPSMAKIKEIRKSIGTPTIFNLLGPLVNPAIPDYQVIGVYDAQKCKLVAEALLSLQIKEAIVVHGADGLDEFSTTGQNVFYHVKDGRVSKKYLSPEDLGLKKADLSELKGGDSEENAEILLNILRGENGAKRDIVLLNSAVALAVSGVAKDFKEGIKLAAKSIDSGAALKVLEKLQNVFR